MQPALTSWNLNQWTKTDMTESSPWRRWAAGSWRARTRARHLGQQNGCLQPNRIKQVATITNSNRITITDWCSEQTAICWVLLLFFFYPLPKRALNLIWGINLWPGWVLLGSNIARASMSPNTLSSKNSKRGTGGGCSPDVIFIK